MSTLLLPMRAGLGAAEHGVSLAESLRDRGHRVIVVSSPVGVSRYRRLGFETHDVPEPAMPMRQQALAPVVQRARQLYLGVQRTVIDPTPAQWAVVGRLIAEEGVDALVTDGLFVGASMLAARPADERPPVVMLGFSAPWIPDPLVPPYGMGIAPSEDSVDRLRAGAYELLAARAMARLSRSFNAQIQTTFGLRIHGDLRATPAFADAWAQLTVERFEYPRAAPPSNFHFVGPLRPRADDAIPDWWDPRTEPPVIAIHATSKATVADVVEPTIRAYGDTPSTIVVGGADRRTVAMFHARQLPSNVHFEPSLPWSRLIPQRTVVISDGDYLHTQHALRRGIPLVVAGTLETDVETAARVAWAGAGIDLRTGRPSPMEIRRAVEAIRADEGFRLMSARVAAQIAGTDAEATIGDLVEEAIDRWTRRRTRGDGAGSQRPAPGPVRGLSGTHRAPAGSALREAAARFGARPRVEGRLGPTGGARGDAAT